MKTFGFRKFFLGVFSLIIHQIMVMFAKTDKTNESASTLLMLSSLSLCIHVHQQPMTSSHSSGSRSMALPQLPWALPVAWLIVKSADDGTLV